METAKERFTRHPKLPTEQVIHYIVKDYRRMYNDYWSQRERADKAEAELSSLQDKYSDVRSKLNSLKKSSENALSDAVSSMESKLEKLREELNVANRKNVMLAQALTDSDKASVLLSRLDTPVSISSDEQIEWLRHVSIQLEKAMQKLDTVEMKLSGVERIASGVYSDEQLTSALKRFRNVYGKIDSATSRIENFFNMIGKIEVQDKYKPHTSENDVEETP